MNTSQKTILNNDQIKLLGLISEEKTITDNFYLGGGTALAEYYLHHRLSEDLDFFSEQAVEVEGITIFLKKISDNMGIKNVNYQQSFNRNLFLLSLEKQEIKTEFTYYPFSRIQEGKKIGSLKIDSLLDIAVNKVFTIYQKPRSRDFFAAQCQKAEILKDYPTLLIDLKDEIWIDYFLDISKKIASDQIGKAE